MQPDAELYPWISVAALAWGLLDCFFGYRVFKFTLALAGGLFGALFAQAAATALGLGASGVTISLVAGGLIGAGLAFLLYIAAVFVAGFFFGATLGLLLLANFHHMVALLSGVLLGIVGGFLAVRIQRILIILSTGLFGAFRAMLAAGYFVGAIDWWYYFRQVDQIPALIDNTPWLLPSILALAAVGVIAQLEPGGRDGRKKKTPARDD